MFKKINHLLEKYEYIWSPASLVIGFFLDNLTLQRIDLSWSQTFLTSYLIIIFLGIIFSFKFKKPLFLLIIQFFMGGLFSAYFVFSVKSSFFSANWPFIFFIFTYLIANEFFKKYYQHLIVRIGVYFVALYSFFIFTLPIFAKQISSAVFIWSGVISLFIIYLLILILFLINKKEVRKYINLIFVNIMGIFVIINTLYFTHAIPPLPLSIKEIGFYKNIYRTLNGEYTKIPFENNILKQTVYVFASIYAPFKFDTKIYHVWEFKNEDTGKWEQKSKVEILIVGGREAGYRSYSFKNNLEIGKWRVKVVSENNLIIGQKYFEIKN